MSELMALDAGPGKEGHPAWGKHQVGTPGRNKAGHQAGNTVRVLKIENLEFSTLRI